MNSVPVCKCKQISRLNMEVCINVGPTKTEEDVVETFY